MLIMISLLVASATLALCFYAATAHSAQHRFFADFILYDLLVLALAGIVSQLLGLKLPIAVSLCAFSLVLTFMLWKTIRGFFWAKLVYQALFVLMLSAAGYLYTTTQLPLEDKPFAALSNNGPKPFSDEKGLIQWISGLPRLTDRPADPNWPGHSIKPVKNSPPRIQTETLWSQLNALMQKDAQIRKVLENLKRNQERALSETLSNLNSASVINTRMRRHALDQDKVRTLFDESAISSSHYHTIVETWRLLDADENAFRERQREELFHSLLELLEDTAIDESNKVELIRFMVDRFAKDVRLVHPLINLYERLDSEYPRQKRLNLQFMELYIAKRDAILKGFAMIGPAALQPLLDYRNKTISQVSYSQVALDAFISSQFGVKIRPLYGVLNAQSIPNFLNRPKYPPLKKLAGASFEQEFVRENLLRLNQQNQIPNPGQPVMQLDLEKYQDLMHQLAQGDQDRLDYLLIDPDPAIRGNVAWHLAEQKNPYLVPYVFELMKDADPEVRRLATIAIGNFKILDAQGSNDPKLMEILGMLQNYRSNVDAFGRAFAVLALPGIGDKQKALYVIDLLLNDGAGSNSILGESAPTWRSEEEKQLIQGLAQILAQTPEELFVKTQALNALIAMNTPEALDILLHYLNHIYATQHARPSIWRFIVPHMSLPQEAENVEDLIFYLAGQSGQNDVHKRHLKALHMFLKQAYAQNLSGAFFQALSFLKAFDHQEYQSYLANNDEQIRIMSIREYTQATHVFWLVFWPVSLLLALFVNYAILPALNFRRASIQSSSANRRANPAANARSETVAPPSAIVPIKIHNAH